MVIPVHDVNPVRRPAVVTYLIVAVNVAVFLLGPASFAVLDGTSPAEVCRQQAYFAEYGAVPRELLGGPPPQRVPGPPARDATGRVGCLAVPPGYVKTPLLSVLTAMFVQAGWVHLLGNMLYLLIFGNNVEDRLGRVRYLLFYLLSGVAAAYGYAVVNAASTTPLVGASGAIAGVLGAYLMMFPRARVWSLVPVLFFLPLRLPAWLVLGLWFLLQWLYAQGTGVGSGANVAYLAHVVGFVLGLLVGAAIGPPRRPRPGHALPGGPYRPPGRYG